MINNFKCCYISLDNPKRYYVKVKNYINLCVRYILQYSIYSGTVTKQIDIYGGQEKSYFIPIEGENVCMNILDCSLPMTTLIYHECIEERYNICYKIQGTVQNPICIKTIC
ncbi:hypothetical protein [Clostridium haemolyticum]|uniref:Uncharacterized protein n=1 Tax=Clostridium haemolyticum NCTC 9693 TaxID=1443114 RepID=A0ABR4TBI5_CLOHA|nr:hypothetical protein [Clostridium haemolyticum]KEI14462.1 hypothetical protein Z960_12475 [Clostridium haemolyticum NCTC 9693]KGM98756.1 hypothetical protein Z961_12135 [Clostridium haemolyticum NCTC 8350]